MHEPTVYRSNSVALDEQKHTPACPGCQILALLTENRALRARIADLESPVHGDT